MCATLVKALIIHLQIMNLKLFSFFTHPAPCDNFSTIFLNLSLNAVYPYFMRLKSFELLCMNENSDPNVISVAKKKKIICVHWILKLLCTQNFLERLRVHLFVHCFQVRSAALTSLSSDF